MFTNIRYAKGLNQASLKMLVDIKVQIDNESGLNDKDYSKIASVISMIKEVIEKYDDDEEEK